MDRRDFLKSGSGNTWPRPAILAQRNPNDRIGVAMVGVGTRGIYLLGARAGVPQHRDPRHLRPLRLQHRARPEDGLQQNRRSDHQGVGEGHLLAGHRRRVHRHARLLARPHGHPRRANEEARLRREGLLPHLAGSQGHPQGGPRQQGDAPTRPSPEQRPHLHQGARDLPDPASSARSTLARTYIDRTNAWPEWQFYTGYDNQELPADATAETDRLGTLPGAMPPSRPSSTPSVSSAGAAGGNTAPASPAT